MAYQLRKCEKYTNWEATGVVELNPDDFTTLSEPYTGSTEEEFMNYIQEMYDDDWYAICDELESLGLVEAADALSLLFEGEMEIYSSTTDSEENAWIEIGETDDEYRKYGGFKSNHTTLNEDW